MNHFKFERKNMKETNKEGRKESNTERKNELERCQLKFVHLHFQKNKGSEAAFELCEKVLLGASHTKLGFECWWLEHVVICNDYRNHKMEGSTRAFITATSDGLPAISSS